MRSLNNYITEKFQVSKDNIRKYVYHPKDRNELIECIKNKIEKEGLGTEDEPLDLNDIDTSKITNMCNIFDADDGELKFLSKNGYFDISDWDVSNVENMYGMFWESAFYGDISEWDVSNVRDMSYMFFWSKFDGDISNWDVSKVENMERMFAHAARFNCNLSKWNTKHVENMKSAFYGCPAVLPKWFTKQI